MSLNDFVSNKPFSCGKGMKVVLTGFQMYLTCDFQFTHNKIFPEEAGWFLLIILIFIYAILRSGSNLKSLLEN